MDSIYSTQGCDIALRSVGAITVAGGVTEFLPSSRVQLSCTYTNLNMMRQPPIWYHYDNRSYSRLHLLDGYDEKEDFDEDSCMWRSVLTIKQLTQQQTGTYVCIHSTNSVNTTISLQSKSHRNHNSCGAILWLCVTNSSSTESHDILRVMRH